MSWWLFWMILVAAILLLAVIVFCPGLCFCVPSYCYDSGWHYDSFLGMEIPNRRGEWPLLDAKTRGEKMEGDNMHWDRMNNTLYQQDMTKRRNIQGTSRWGGHPQGFH
jgi:hypothetical protein